MVDFTKDDLDEFSVTDLRSTDFIKAGGSYFKPITSTTEILANPLLADALLLKTEFTQQEWDAFVVLGLRMHHLVKSVDLTKSIDSCRLKLSTCWKDAAGRAHATPDRIL